MSLKIHTAAKILNSRMSRKDTVVVTTRVPYMEEEDIGAHRKNTELEAKKLANAALVKFASGD